jgi:hypothetical protein
MIAIPKHIESCKICSSPEYPTWILEACPRSLIYEVELHQVGKRHTRRREVSSGVLSRAHDSSALREKGFSAADEKKIIALKDFIVKQAHATRA